MPLATSDFRNPVCQELRSLRSSGGSGVDRAEIGGVVAVGGGVVGGFAGGGGAGGGGGSVYTEARTSPLQALPDAASYGKPYNEQGSIDSSDTYASCQTHPFYSQGDLTEEADSNLYVNPLEAAEKCGTRVKKSTSGEVGRNVTDASPSVESLKDLRPFNEQASKITLNDVLPKHRKIRIQQSGRPRAQFLDTTENNNNLYGGRGGGGLRGGRPPSGFAPTNSLVSATRIINHHLFGSIAGPRHYTGTSNAESKLSLSADSIDSEGVPFIDRHRVSKSILKKSESSNNYYCGTSDSDTEKLITDNASTMSMCDNETSACDAPTSGTRTTKQPVSPLLSRQVLESIFRTNNNAEREYATEQIEGKNCLAKIPKLIFDDVLEEEKHARDETVTENKNKESEEHKQRTRMHTEEASKGPDGQTMLICSLRPYKVVRKSEEKRKAATSSNKSTTGHGSSTTTIAPITTTPTSYKSSDANCLSQDYQFSS